MKEIILKILDEESKVNKLSYKEIILTILKTPTKDGLTIEDIRQSVKIIEKIEPAKEAVQFEDAEYNYLKKKINAFKWAIPHKNIITFIDDYNNTNEVKK